MKTAKSCGAVIIHHDKGKIEFLVIKHKPEAGGHWMFPKGHIEKGETEEETAKREIHEETGLEVKFIQGFRETIEYFDHVREEQKLVVFFLCEATTKEVKYIFDEVEDHKWLQFNDALKIITHENSKEILRKAEKFIKDKKI